MREPAAREQETVTQQGQPEPKQATASKPEHAQQHTTASMPRLAEVASKKTPVLEDKTAWQPELAPQQQMVSKQQPVLERKTAQELKLAPARQIVREQQIVEELEPPGQEQESVLWQPQEQKKAQESLRAPKRELIAVIRS